MAENKPDADKRFERFVWNPDDVTIISTPKKPQNKDKPDGNGPKDHRS